MEFGSSSQAESYRQPNESAGAAAMTAMPLPTDPVAGTFVNFAETLQQNNDNYQGRVDYAVNSKWNVFSRYSIADETPLIPGVVTGRQTDNPARTQNAVVGATAVLRANLINEARFGFSRLRVLNGTPEPLSTSTARKWSCRSFR